MHKHIHTRFMFCDSWRFSSYVIGEMSKSSSSSSFSLSNESSSSITFFFGALGFGRDADEGWCDEERDAGGRGVGRGAGAGV